MVHLNVVNDTTRRNVDDSGAGNKNIYRRPDQRGRLQVCGQTERTLVEATETGARVGPPNVLDDHFQFGRELTWCAPVVK